VYCDESTDNMTTYYEKLLPPFVAFQSISTDSAYAAECHATAAWLVELFATHGFTAKTWPGNATNPTVYATYEIDPDLPTVLVYGHYDVQPASQQDGWRSNPFVVRETDTHYYARGVIDNKGQVLVHIAAVIEHIEAGTLGYNVQFLLEGNEESGNAELPDLIEAHRDDLSCDIVLISDGQLIGSTPLIERSFRGGGNLRIGLKTAANDLHSGIYGGAVPSASETLVHLLAQLHDTENRVNIPGFYTDVPEIPDETRETHRTLQDNTSAAISASVTQLRSPDGVDFLSQTGLRPALLVSGVESGYVGNGFKNIVPAVAEARINIRTVPGQKTEHILQLVADYVRAITPEYADVSIDQESHGDPIELTGGHSLFKKAQAQLANAYGTPAVFHHVGGSIPVIAELQRTLKCPVLSIPLANEDCNMHGVEENYNKDLLAKAFVFSREFWAG
jgi:acetylornithine deacetylase/succinyl-diaminopimelate desuccinylase-like protein